MQAIAKYRVEQLLSYPDLVHALCELYSGKRQVVLGDRVACTTETPRIWLGVSGALLSDSGFGIAKVGLESYAGKNSELKADSSIAIVDGKQGKILATVAAETLTAKRTAATTLAIAKLLKRDNIQTLTTIGTGVQAKAHLDACDACLSLDRLYLCGRTRDRAEAFLDKFAGRWHVPIVPTDNPKTAIAESQMAIAVTSSATPVILGEYLHPGLHVAAIGAYEGCGKELDARVSQQSDLILVDSVTGAMQTADLEPLKRQQTPPIFTPQEYFLSDRDLSSSTAITLWKSVGTAEQDLMAAEILWKSFIKAEKKV